MNYERSRPFLEGWWVILAQMNAEQDKEIKKFSAGNTNISGSLRANAQKLLEQVKGLK